MGILSFHFDSWQWRFPGVDTLKLIQIYQEPDMLDRVCMAHRTIVQNSISVLQSMGLLTFADTQHEPVTRMVHVPPITLLE